MNAYNIQIEKREWVMGKNIITPEIIIFCYYGHYIPWNMHIVLLCFVLLWLYNEFLVDLCVQFIHILQGCFTDTGAIMWLPQCQWSNPEYMGEVNQQPTTHTFRSHFTGVSEWSNLTAFLGTADSEVHIVHISRVITAYTLESLSSLTYITHFTGTGYNIQHLPQCRWSNPEGYG